MNIVVAVDFSDVTPIVLDALPALLPDSSTDEHHVYLIHVAEPDPEFVGWEAGPDVVREQMAEEFAREHSQIAELAEGLQGALEIEVTPLLVQGPTAETVCSQAESLDAAMIVVGSHGHGAAYDLVVGSVSSAIIKQCQRAVLVVPANLGG
jgi:nucleotide-binding universal stress UspA family protein